MSVENPCRIPEKPQLPGKNIAYRREMKLSHLSPPYCFGFFREKRKSIYDALKRTAMHDRAISYINLPKTYDDAILAQFVVNLATDSNRTIRVECLRCHHTCQIFKCRFAVGQLSVNCWDTAG